VDENAVQPGQSFDVTNTPYQNQSLDISRGNLGVSRAQLGLSERQFTYNQTKDAADRAAKAAEGGKPATESQSNAVMFGIRAVDTDKTLRDMEQTYKPTGLGALKDMTTQGKPMSNWMASDEGQKYFNAGKNFVAAIMRKESGAQINESEWAMGTALYVPMPGDSKQVLTQKKRNRELAIQGLKAAAGPYARDMVPQTSGATGGWSIEPAN
jgi:hypothetical protein